MQIEIHADKKLVTIWLRNDEPYTLSDCPALKPVLHGYRRMKYLVAVFHSGKEDLEELTKALLLYNRRKLAMK